MEENNTLSVDDIKSQLISDMNFGEEKGDGKKEEVKRPILADILKSLQEEADKKNRSTPNSPQKPKINNMESSIKQNTHKASEESGLNQEKIIEKNDSIVKEILKEEKDFINEGNSAKIVTSQKKHREKNKGYKNSYIYGFIFIIGSVLLEITNFVRLGLGFLPTCFGIEFSIILMLAGIIFLVPTEAFKIIMMSIFIGVQLIMNVINASLYKVLYELVTVDMIFTLNGETADVFEWSRVDFLSIGFSLLVVGIIVGLIILGNKYMPKFKIRKAKTAIVSFLILVFSIEILSFSCLKMFEVGYFANAEATQYVDNDEFLYNNTTASKFASLKRFGFWGFYVKSLNNVLFNKSLKDDQIEDLKKYVKDGENYSYSNSTYSGIDVSGSLSGDNLIVIMMESMEWFAIDPYNTPYLYDFLQNYSVQFTNFHSNNKTNISEQISLLGNSPYEKSFSMLNNTVGIDVPNSLPNLFKEQGYESVNYFHDYKETFYQRHIINKKIGFSNVYAMEQCPIDNKSEYFGDFLDDGEFIEAYKEQFMPNNKNFFSFFTTITTHGPYERSNERYSEYYERFDENYQAFCDYVIGYDLNYHLPEKGTNEYVILKEYKSKAMALDNAINVILNYLKTTRDAETNTPLYDNTTIVLFGDHNCYYSDLGFNTKGVKKYSNDKDIYNIPFAIFNKSLPAGKIDAFCNTFDIFPTICDLYGISYNKNLTQGYSALSEDIQNSLFVSAMTGIFDNDYYTTTLDDYTPQNMSLDTNAKLVSFKQKADNYFKRQEYIENYYSINFSKNYN